MRLSGRQGRRGARASRVLGGLAAAAIALGLEFGPAAPAAGAEQTGLETDEVEHLAFDGDLKDATSNGLDGSLVGGQEAYVAGTKGKALKLDGKQHVSLGTSTKLQPSSLTLSFWIDPNAPMKGEQILSWSKGTYTEPGWYVSTNDDHGITLSITDAAGTLGEFYANVDRAQAMPAGSWTHVAVTYDGATRTAAFYLNGQGVAGVTTGRQADKVGPVASSDVEKGIGWNGPVYKANSLNAAIDEYRLFSRAATPAEVRALYQDGGGTVDESALVKADADALEVPSSAVGPFDLPLTGKNGSTISWTSSDDSAISIDPKTGTATPHSSTAEKTAVLTAQLSLGKETAKRDFSVDVLAQTAGGAIYLSGDGLRDAEVTDAWIANGREKNTDFLLKLSAQRFLYNFYATSHVSQPAGNKPYMNSWEQDTSTKGGNFRGHAAGHYLSALAQAYVQERDQAKKARLLARAREMLDGLKTCQDAWGKLHPADAGYVSAFPEGSLSRIDGQPAVDQGSAKDYQPYYSLHKVVAGLVDAAELLPADQGGQEAQDIAHQLGVYLNRRLVGKAEGRFKQPLNSLGTMVEFGSMNDALYRLYALTGDEQVKRAADVFNDDDLYELFAKNVNQSMSGMHANATIPKFYGAISKYYVLTSNKDLYDKLSASEKAELPLYLKSAELLWQNLVENHTFANGGNSVAEHLWGAKSPYADATQHGTDQAYGNSSTDEDCNIYNMLKLTRVLFQVTKDPKYADYYQWAFTNQILAAQNPETGVFAYFEPMDTGYFKVYDNPTPDPDGTGEANASKADERQSASAYDEPNVTRFWCDTGTGMENASKYGDSAYFVDGANGAHDLYVNQLIASTFNAGNGFTVKQDALFPKRDTATFRVSGAPAGARLRLLVPSWAAGVPTVTVGGKPLDPSAYRDVKPGTASYLDVPVSGDVTVSYKVPMAVKAQVAPDNASYAAFSYGPVLLSAPLPSGTDFRLLTGGANVQTSNYDYTALNQIVPIHAESAWVQGAAGNLVRTDDPNDGGGIDSVRFKLRNVAVLRHTGAQKEGVTVNDAEPSSITFQPWHTVVHGRYGLYFNLGHDNDKLTPASAAAPAAVATTAGTAPVLPQSVQVTWSDKSTSDEAVTWDTVLPSAYDAAGTFTVSGMVAGLKVQVTVNVQEAVAGRHLVSFNSEGGSAVAAQQVEDGKPAAKPADPTRDGYVFGGWLLNGQPYDFSKPVTGPLTLTAKWTPSSYQVRFDAAGGSAVAAQQVDAGKPVAKPADPARDGYVFGGWLLNGRPYDFSKPVTGPLTLTAKWTKYVAVKGIALGSDFLTLRVGTVMRLVATVTPADATDPAATWSSSNPAAVSVSSDGTVTCRAEGAAVITVTTRDGGKKASCRVTATKVDPTRGFADLTAKDWAVKEGWVGYSVDNGLMSGLNPADHGGRKLFDPYAHVNRAQVAVILWRMAGSPTDYKAPARDFADNKKGAAGNYWYEAVRWANSVGVVTGIKDPGKDTYTNFGPNNNIWRQDFALMIFRYAEKVGGLKNPNTDRKAAQKVDGWGEVADYARDGVAWAVNSKLMGGVKLTAIKTDLQPRVETDRSAAAKMTAVLKRDVLRQ